MAFKKIAVLIKVTRNIGRASTCPVYFTEPGDAYGSVA